MSFYLISLFKTRDDISNKVVTWYFVQKNNVYMIIKKSKLKLLSRQIL